MKETKRERERERERGRERSEDIECEGERGRGMCFHFHSVDINLHIVYKGLLTATPSVVSHSHISNVDLIHIHHNARENIREGKGRESEEGELSLLMLRL